MTIQKKKVHLDIDPHLQILVHSLTRKTFMANKDYQKLFTSLVVNAVNKEAGNKSGL